MPNNPLIEAFRQTLMNMGQNERNLGQGVPPPPMYQRPEVNLDPIRIIQSLTGGGQPQAQAPQQPQMPLPPQNIASPMENVGLAGQQGQQTPQGNGINWQMLMDIGIPALSAIIGTAAPGTLAGAAGLSTGYTGAREKQREREFELEKEGVKKEYNITTLTPSERNYKRKQQKDYLENYAQNKSNRRFIEEARRSLENIPGGASGSINLRYKKYFDPDSPLLGDWQKVKAILTDTTLLHTMKTKGAISDREMEEFKQAAANDIISKPRITAAFDRYQQILDAEDEGKLDAFYASFGEDPRKGYKPDEKEFSSMSTYSDLSDEEIDARIQELEGRQ